MIVWCVGSILCVVCGGIRQAVQHETEDRVVLSWAPNKWSMALCTTHTFCFFYVMVLLIFYKFPNLKISMVLKQHTWHGQKTYHMIMLLYTIWHTKCYSICDVANHGIIDQTTTLQTFTPTPVTHYYKTC